MREIHITFRKAEIQDLEEIMLLIKNAITNMEAHHINQWDSRYPSKEIIQSDIEMNNLVIGVINQSIAVIYVINDESDQQYEHGQWQYPDSQYCILHRLCVNPSYQNLGVAKYTLEHIEASQKALGTQTI